MKQWIIIIAVLLLLLVGGYFAFYKTIMPNVVSGFVPIRWQNVPLGESKAVVHDYLGTPDTVILNNETWIQKLNSSKKYILQVEYKGDTVLSAYKITYEVDLMGFHQITQVKTDSLK